jgi:cobalt-zinc-cadmium efflux system protein
MAHSHAHAPANFGRAFAIGVTLNFGFVLVEVGFGLWAHSLALVADAGHNLSDVFGLLLAWGAVLWSKRAPTKRHTYGWRRSSILAALANAVFLLVSIGVIAWEAIRRLVQPPEVDAHVLIWVSAAGIAVNGVTAALFASGRKHDLNVRAAFLHMAADALISAGVVVAGVLILFTHWLWLDPVVSLVLAVVILVGTWGLLRDSVRLAMDAVPEAIDLTEVSEYLAGLPSVLNVHHVHVWGLSTNEAALTAHLVLETRTTDNALLTRINHDLCERFGIGHATIQFEAPGSECPMGGCEAEAHE